MINLIPSQDKKRMVRDFYSRLIATIFIMLGVCALVTAVAVFPSYFSAVLKKNLANQKFEAQEKEPLPSVDQETLNTMDNIKAKLELIENTERNTFLVSEKIIKEIISSKTNNIKITKINYEHSPTKGRFININGTAPSREELLTFRKILENNKSFKDINLPISNFIKGTDIQFNLTLVAI